MEANEPPLLLRVFFGGLLGAIGALAFLACETALVGRYVAAIPLGDLAMRVALLYAVTGALLGAFVAAVGRSGAAWGLCVAAGWAGWLLSGKLGEFMELRGWPAGEGALILLPLALGFAWAMTMDDERDEPLHVGGAVALFTATLLAVPINQHLLGEATSSLALTIDGVILCIAAVAGVAAGALMGRLKVLFQLLLLAGGVGAIAAGSVVNPPPAPWPSTSSRGTPIVLIVVDTLRADHLGSYGYKRRTSPRLDAFASSSLRYANASSTAPWTLPSVASILTGRLPSDHRAGANGGSHNLKTPLRADLPTAATLLGDSGYTTAAVVTNPWLLPAFGVNRGFQRYDARVAELPLPAAVHPLQVLDVDPIGWPAYRDATHVTDAALEFVQAQRGGRWFLLVHYMDPHGPLVPPAEDVAALGAPGEDPLVDAYDASVRYLDRELGRLLAHLPAAAAIVIVSDHGEQLTEQRLDANRAPANTRHGHHLHAELLDVPLFVRPPLGGFSATVQRPVSTLDILPTIARFAGVEPPASLPGHALGEVWGEPGRVEVQPAEALLYGGEWRSVSNASYKLIQDADDRVRVFDRRRDPIEVAPLPEGGPEAAQARDALIAKLPTGSPAAAAPPVALGRQVQELLEQLGYVEAEPEPAANEQPR